MLSAALMEPVVIMLFVNVARPVTSSVFSG